MKGKVLITGGAGFIGSHTADLLHANGYEVVLWDNLSEPVHDGSKLWPNYIKEDYQRILGDTADKQMWVKALEGVSHVLHLAAYQDLLPVFSRFATTNVVSTANLYEVIVEKKLPIERVVIASSQFVYGEGKYQCDDHGVVYPDGRLEQDLQRGDWEVKCPVCRGKVERLDLTEDHQDPGNQYSITKYAQELLGLKLGRLYHIPTNAMRYSIVQGPRQSYRNSYSGALRLFVTRMLLGIKPVIFEDGGQLRDYVSVHDVAAANLVAMESQEVYQNYNVGGGRGYTVIEFAETVEKVLGTNVGYQLTGEYRVGDTRHSVSDISKLKNLGWEPIRKIEDSIREYFEWVKDVKLDREAMLAADRRMRESGAIRKSA